MSVMDCKAEVSKGMERMVEGFAMWYLTHTDPGDEQVDPCGSCVYEPDKCGHCLRFEAWAGCECALTADVEPGEGDPDDFEATEPINNAPCFGCAERCGQCNES